MRKKSMKELMRDNRGSEVLSSLIIAATILIITIISASVATWMIGIQAAKAEYEAAKESMIELADIVEEVGSKMYSSSYVKFNCRYGGLDFLKNSTHIQVTLETSAENITLIDAYTSSLRYRGRTSFPVTEEYVRGGEVSIVVGEASPIVSIYTELDENGYPTIWLRGESIRLVEAGTRYLESRGYNVTVYQLIFFRMTIGATFGSGSLNIRVYGKPFSVDSYLSEAAEKIHLIVDGTEADWVQVDSRCLMYVVLATVEVAIV